MTLFRWLLLFGLSVSTLGDGLVNPWPHAAYTQDPADTFGPTGAGPAGMVVKG